VSTELYRTPRGGGPRSEWAMLEQHAAAEDVEKYFGSEIVDA
jgi:hypothetical protein